MSDGIEYCNLSSADLDDVEDLLAVEFYPRENVSLSVHADGKTSKGGMNRNMMKLCLASGVSVGARDKATGALVGVRTTYISTRESEKKVHQEEVEYSSEGERKLYFLLGKAKDLYDVFQDPEVEKVLDFDRLCVHRDYCRRGIAKKLVEISMDLGKKKGCQLARTEISSPYSEKVFLGLGFETKAKLNMNKETDIADPSLMTYKALAILTKRL